MATTKSYFSDCNIKDKRIDMDYKEKYEQAMERARQFSEKPYLEDSAGIVEYIFPELAESKDEKIREVIIKFFKLQDDKITYSLVPKKDILAWLEKHKYTEDDLDKAYKCADEVQYRRGYEDAKKEIEKQGEQKPEGKTALEAANEEKVDNQNCVKPADKVEPKFKAGDKIYLKPEYRMPDDDTPIANTVKEIIRIDDKYYRFDGSYIFIEDQDKYELVEQKPADNEMIEILRAEYEKGRADAIEEIQNPAWSKEDEQILNAAILHIKNETYNYYGGYSSEYIMQWLKSIKDKVQPKQEWTEEDENILQGIWDEVLANKHNSKECEWKTYDKFLNWLESIKDRVQPQPKQEWSEEDKEIIDYLIDYLESGLDSSYTDLDKETFTKEINWLKSLKPQLQWKPSYEQISVLEFVMKDIEKDSIRYAVLNSVLEQLKKLK